MELYAKDLKTIKDFENKELRNVFRAAVDANKDMEINDKVIKDY